MLALLHDPTMKRTAQRSTLHDWQQEDAGRLKGLIAIAKRKQGWPGMDEFAADALGKSGSFLSQLASGYRPLNLQHAIALAKGLGVGVDEISPTLARILSGTKTPAHEAQPKSLAIENRRGSEFDRSVFRALKTLEPDVRMSIKTVILALAAAKNPNYAQWLTGMDQFNSRRESPTKRPARKREKEAK